MTRRLYTLIAFLGLFCLLASLWQVVEIMQLGPKLQKIDEESQRDRLINLSIPRIEQQAQDLLQAQDEAILQQRTDFKHPYYAIDTSHQADFNRGYFTLSPTDLRVAKGDAALERSIAMDAQLLDTMRRKAENPDAPLFNPNESHQLTGEGQVPVFGIYEVLETDLSKPITITGESSPFFTWSDGKQLIRMRNIPTSHGKAAEGYIIDQDHFIKQLTPFIESGLIEGKIIPSTQTNPPNIKKLPLTLDGGQQLILPDAKARERALGATIISSWLFCVSSTLLIMGLLLIFIRYERRRSDMIAAVTHELRTPLTSMRLATEMLKEKLVPAEKLESYHNNIYTESLRLSHLVENVLAFSRISHQSSNSRPDSGSCKSTLLPLLEKIAQHVKQAGFSFNLHIDQRCEMMKLRTDLLLLEQILTNLADNSLKYGRGKQASITISLEHQRRNITLRFSDKGSGIEESMKKHIFTPFKRGIAQSGKPGIGLGLALSRDLARALGGDLKLESSKPSGTSFLLTLPTGL